MNLMNATPEPFNAQRQSEIDHAEYERGFQAATRGEFNTTFQTLAWHRGWADAQELHVTSSVLPAYPITYGLKATKAPITDPD
jgi:hypothetical protein